MKITPLGDSAVVIHLLEDVPVSPARAVRQVLSVRRALEHASIPGVVEIASASASVAVFFDPARAIEAGAAEESVIAWIEERIQAAVPEPKKLRLPKPDFRLVRVPVCFDLDLAPDLAEVAANAGLSVAEVVEAYCAVEYLVSCIGFTPGFPYLSGLPAKLTAPRRAMPRQEVPAGSVAIGGDQTGIYPLASPGGWNLIGRTPLALFDSAKNPPALLSPGDSVRFQPISLDEFSDAAARPSTFEP